MEKKIYKGYTYEVGIDDFVYDSPRDWGNLGYFITCERDYNSPDKNDMLERIIKDTGEIASSCDEHIKMILDELVDWDEKVLQIYPVSKYEHGNIVYSLGERHGFDSGVSGFYIVTDKSAQEIGASHKDFERIIKDELQTYTQWTNGEVYNYYCEETGDSCGGFYDLEDCVSEAENAIDYDIRQNGRPKRELQAKKDKISEFITSDNEKVSRHAKGIAKELNKLSL